MPITEIFLNLCFWLILLFSAPIITMRLFALEKYSGTFETLDDGAGGGRGGGAGQVHRRADFLHDHVAAAAGLHLHSALFHPRVEPGGTGTLASTFLGIFLLGSLYMAVGLFCLGADPQPDRGGHDQLCHRGWRCSWPSFLADQFAPEKNLAGARR